MKLMGRIDKIEEHPEMGCFIVTDDYGVNVMYDSTFADMRSLEQEMLKIVSFYINKLEPLQDRDLRNILPAIDRMGIMKEIIECEQQYQKAKLLLVIAYTECLDHTCDTLDQQRLIQIIVDLMAQRPRMNFLANHFRDSYKAEIDAFEAQTQIVREFINMQMDNEYKINNDIREMLEKTYRLIYEQIDNQWQYYPSNDVQDEVKKR